MLIDGLLKPGPAVTNAFTSALLKLAMAVRRLQRGRQQDIRDLAQPCVLPLLEPVLNAMPLLLRNGQAPSVGEPCESRLRPIVASPDLSCPYITMVLGAHDEPLTVARWVDSSGVEAGKAAAFRAAFCLDSHVVRDLRTLQAHLRKIAILTRAASSVEAVVVRPQEQSRAVHALHLSFRQHHGFLAHMWATQQHATVTQAVAAPLGRHTCKFACSPAFRK